MEEYNLDEEQASRGSTENQDPVHQSVPEGNETKMSQGNVASRLLGITLTRGQRHHISIVTHTRIHPSIILHLML